MGLIVQKFGGTSVGTPERVRAVAARIARASAGGDRLVVVVSAMGEATDDLLALAEAVTDDPRRRHPRELDMLLTAGERISMALLTMAIRDAGVEAVSLTGSQAAIITDTAHTGARIEEVRGDRVRTELDAGRVVIVAGFQGVSRQREVTTLGRGGSDTTAVALAAALGADRCDIFTDVSGVFTADPRVVADARRIERLDYHEMLEMAQSGARVLHHRAVELGARYGVPIRVLSSFEERDGEGTLITNAERGMEEPAVTGLASETGHARLVLRGLPPRLGPTARVLSRLSAGGISVDMVAQADRADGRRQLQLTVREDSLVEATALCETLISELGGESVEAQTGLCRVSLVGSGMHGRAGVYARAFEALLASGVEVYAVSTSAISITILVEREREEDALRALHDAFELGAAP